MERSELRIKRERLEEEAQQIKEELHHGVNKDLLRLTNELKDDAHRSTRLEAKYNDIAKLVATLPLTPKHSALRNAVFYVLLPASLLLLAVASNIAWFRHARDGPSTMSVA